MWFVKYQGTGNDFIFVHECDLTTRQLAFLCDRRLGVGADGLVMYKNCAQADYAITYYNADGSTGAVCGNASRCSVHFARSMGLQKDQFQFYAGEVMLHGGIQPQPWTSFVDVEQITRVEGGFFVHTGAPHLVCLVQEHEDLSTYPVQVQGQKWRHHPQFPQGVNVNFVQPLSPNALSMRTYERGVEAETLSCATGSVASALVCASMHQHIGQIQIQVHAPGGQLCVRARANADGSFSHITLAGAVTRVYEGNIILG